MHELFRAWSIEKHRETHPPHYAVIASFSVSCRCYSHPLLYCFREGKRSKVVKRETLGMKDTGA